MVDRLAAERDVILTACDGFVNASDISGILSFSRCKRLRNIGWLG